MNDLPWSVVRKDTGETIAMFANQWDAAGFRNNLWLTIDYEFRPTPSRTCATCEWWHTVGDPISSGFCKRGVRVDVRERTPADFSCNRWEAKDAAKK